MSHFRNTLIWSFIALLFAFAFLRSLASNACTERSHVLALAPNSGFLDVIQNKEELQTIRNELDSERHSLQKCRNQLENQSKKLRQLGAHLRRDSDVHDNYPRYTTPATPTNSHTIGLMGKIHDTAAADTTDIAHIADILSDHECHIILVSKSSRTGFGHPNQTGLESSLTDACPSQCLHCSTSHYVVTG